MSCPLGRVGFLELVTFEPGLGERGSTRLQGPGALGRQREEAVRHAGCVQGAAKGQGLCVSVAGGAH